MNLVNFVSRTHRTKFSAPGAEHGAILGVSNPPILLAAPFFGVRTQVAVGPSCVSFVCVCAGSYAVGASLEPPPGAFLYDAFTSRDPVLGSTKDYNVWGFGRRDVQA